MHKFELQKKIYNLAFRRGCIISLLKSITFKMGECEEKDQLLDVIGELEKPVEESKYRLPDLES